MHIAGICINADGDHLGGSLAQLEADLTLFRQSGFDGVELSIPGLDVVSGGRLQRSQVDRVRAITERFDPVPRGDHAVPSHLAMWFAATPPAVVKSPPT